MKYKIIKRLESDKLSRVWALTDDGKLLYKWSGYSDEAFQIFHDNPMGVSLAEMISIVNEFKKLLPFF